jgi:uncharacterized repeat protein (TIGR03803 family)
MKSAQFLASLFNQTATIIAVTLTLVANVSAAERVLHAFLDKPAANPSGGVAFDAAGNLYGMTASSTGSRNGGVVFKLTPNTENGYRILYRFKGGRDGFSPDGDVVLDPAGSIYGVTQSGGGSTSCVDGCGTVFRLAPRVGGGWTESVLYRFRGGKDGFTPLGGLVLDESGNLYGTTIGGGTSGFGTVFELSPSGKGWTKSILYNFAGDSDGHSPEGKLIRDSAGNLYGTTGEGGGSSTCFSFGCGTVFELTPSSGGWSESVLYRFQGGQDGMYPRSKLLFDGVGNLYGTTYYGGSTTCSGGCGVVFELTPNSDGWSEAVLYSFQGEDGAGPTTGVVFDAAGNLFGATSGGGRRSDQGGTVFKLTPSGGTWTETVLQNFGGRSGFLPFANLIIDASNNLYGTTAFGGKVEQGVVFEIIP